MTTTMTTFKAHDRRGTAVIGDVPAGTTPAWFAKCAFDKRWQDMTITRDSEVVGGIGPNPDTGKRDWWGECVA